LLRKALIRAGKTSYTAGTLYAMRAKLVGNYWENIDKTMYYFYNNHQGGIFMTQNNITDFMKAIKENNLLKIKKLVGNDKMHATVCNGKTPKKDAGQSGLQIALKTSNLDIAEFLIEQGANVNFIEDSKISEVSMPVLHDCIHVLFIYSLCDFYKKNKPFYDKAFNIFKIMLLKGANPNAVDCNGNNSFHRAILDIKLIKTDPQFEKWKILQ
jgi:ankyrin repeat protein